MRRVCVFCGSSAGARPEYVTAARKLGELLADRGVGVVYGGASVGVMGALADGALDRGGEVVGVIPEALQVRELPHRGVTRMHVVGSMHERKALMAELSDAFVALPGGLGTLEELFEVLTWGQLGLHRKACGLVNVAGYFDGLLAFLDRAVAEGFVRTEHRRMLLVEDDAPALLDALAAYTPPTVAKWLDRDDT